MDMEDKNIADLHEDAKTQENLTNEVFLS